MRTLDDLFDDERVVEGASPARIDSIETDRQLTALVGGPRRRRPVTDVSVETARLKALVDDATRTGTPIVVTGGSTAGRRNRSPRRRDWVNTGAAVIAVIAIVATAVLTGIQLSTASPAVGALRSLSVDEAALADLRQSLDSSLTRIDTSIDEASARSAEIDTVLAAMSGITDETARVAAQAAVVAYAAGLDAIELPKLPVPYQRESIDKESLPDVAAMINAVQERTILLEQLSVDAREARATIVNLTSVLDSQLASFATGIPAFAATIVEENPRAAQPLQDAVTAAAAGIVATPEASISAVAMLAYVDAVGALRADEARAVAEAEAEARRVPEPRWDGGNGGIVPDPGTPVPEPPTEPVEPPTDPVPEPSVPPTDPIPPGEGQ